MPTMPAPPIATLYVFNVGQGDSLLLHLVNTDEVLLVDSNVARGHTDREPPALRFLKQRAERTGKYDIDLLCLTHPDRDNYTGIADVLEWSEAHGGRVKNLILSEDPDYKTLRDRTLEILRTVGDKARRWELRERYTEFGRLLGLLRRIERQLGPAARTANDFAPVQVIGAAQVYVFGPTSQRVREFRRHVIDDLLKAWVNGETDLDRLSTNEISCVLWCIIGPVKLLLTGDATATALLEAIEAYRSRHEAATGHSLRTEIIKAPHHGAKLGSSPEFWDAMLTRESPHVVISAGHDQRVRHPHIETLHDIRNARPNALLFCTNTCPHYHKRSPLTAQEIRLADRFEDELTLAKHTTIANKPRYAYHGTCRFEIDAAGGIRAECEFNPAEPCPLHAAGVMGVPIECTSAPKIARPFSSLIQKARVTSPSAG
jgi:beta-lactamase superfamily II metal-dependent hydrolase